MKQRVHPSKQGFSILELLVATTVSLILLGLFLSVTTNILDAWSQSRDSLSSNSTARIVLDTIASDLESAILRNDNGIWLACDLSLNQGPSGRWESSPEQKPSGTESLEINFDDPELTATDYRFGVAGSWLRFFASAVDASESSNSGDINAIAYQMIRRKPHSQSSDADESYNLYRAIVRADHTLDEVIEDKGYLIDAFDGASFEGQAGEMVSPRNDSSLLARNVVDFGVVFYASDSLGNKRVLFPKTAGASEFRVPSDETPTSAEVFIRMLDEEGAKQLSAFERGLIPTNDPNFWWNTVTRHSTVHTRWIQFKGGNF